MPNQSAASSPDLESWLDHWRQEIDAVLPALLPAQPTDSPVFSGGQGAMLSQVNEAMAYALLSPAKRIRPTLTLAVGEMYRADTRRLMPAACAIEMVHTASLILDDLPCMDDSNLRRGRPACHTVYGEATAILAAIGLLNHAYAVLAGDVGDAPVKQTTRDRLRAVVARRLSSAIGPDGVIGGQHADLELTHDPVRRAVVDLPVMEYIHSRKTGSLFIASAEVGALLSGALDEEIDSLIDYAKNFGLAFQITDDLIDATGTEQQAGKPVRADTDKATFVTLCGVDGARTLAAELVETALAALAPFGRRAGRLRELVKKVAVRNR